MSDRYEDEEKEPRTLGELKTIIVAGYYEKIEKIREELLQYNDVGALHVFLHTFPVLPPDIKFKLKEDWDNLKQLSVLISQIGGVDEVAMAKARSRKAHEYHGNLLNVLASLSDQLNQKYFTAHGYHGADLEEEFGETDTYEAEDGDKDAS